MQLFVCFFEMGVELVKSVFVDQGLGALDLPEHSFESV